MEGDCRHGATQDAHDAALAELEAIRRGHRQRSRRQVSHGVTLHGDQQQRERAQRVGERIAHRRAAFAPSRPRCRRLAANVTTRFKRCLASTGARHPAWGDPDVFARFHSLQATNFSRPSSCSHHAQESSDMEHMADGCAIQRTHDHHLAATRVCQLAPRLKRAERAVRKIASEMHSRNRKSTQTCGR